MAIQEIKTVLVARFNKTEGKLEHYLTHASWAVDSTDVVLNEDFSVNVIIPEHTQEELALKAINTLRAKQSKAWADAQMTVNHLEEEIKKIQLLTYQPQEPEILYGFASGQSTGPVSNISEIAREGTDKLFTPSEDIEIADFDGGDVLILAKTFTEVPQHIGAVEKTQSTVPVYRVDFEDGDFSFFCSGIKREFGENHLIHYPTGNTELTLIHRLIEIPTDNPKYIEVGFIFLEATNDAVAQTETDLADGEWEPEA